MRSRMFAAAALFAAVAVAQPAAEEKADRVLRFGPAQDMQEIAVVVRGLTDARVTADTGQRTLSLSGAAQKIALADWLFHQLDQPSSAATHERAVPGGDDMVRVFYLAAADTPQRVQEIATQLHRTARIPRVFIYNAPRAIALRGTAAQIALAERMIQEQDR